MKIVHQQDQNDCGMACALMVINHYHQQTLSLSEFKVQHNYHRNELSFAEIEELLKNYQIRAESYQLTSFEELRSNKWSFNC